MKRVALWIFVMSPFALSAQASSSRISGPVPGSAMVQAAADAGPTRETDFGLSRRATGGGTGAAIGAALGALLYFVMHNNTDAGSGGKAPLVFMGVGALFGYAIGSNSDAQREAASP